MAKIKTWLLIFALVISPIQSADAASLADCISVTDAQLKKGLLDNTYEITVRNACGDNFKELLNYSSLSFYAGSSVLNSETSYIYYLQSYGQSFSFKLRNLKPGNYNPYLKISVPKDFSFRTIYLPGFSITDPLNCITFAESQFFNDKFNPLYRVTLENSCSDVSSRDFSKFELELKIPGYFQYISSQSIYSLSNYGSTFDFFLRDIKSGTYFPFLEIRDNYYKTRKIELNPLFIATSPTPIAKKTYNNNGGITPTQVCSLSKNFAEQCADYPNFSFDFCSSLQKASLQEKVGTKWVFLWNVSGKKDSTICTDNKYPFYILVSGQNKSDKKSELRLIFSKTSNISSYTQYFTLEFRR